MKGNGDKVTQNFKMRLADELLVEGFPAKRHVDNDLSPLLLGFRSDVFENRNQAGKIAVLDVFPLVWRVAVAVRHNNHLSVSRQSQSLSPESASHLGTVNI